MSTPITSILPVSCLHSAVVKGPLVSVVTGLLDHKEPLDLRLFDYLKVKVYMYSDLPIYAKGTLSPQLFGQVHFQLEECLGSFFFFTKFYGNWKS